MTGYSHSPTAVNYSTNSLSDDELHLIGYAVLEHLRQESAYLDNVIECGLKLSELLNRSSYAEKTEAPPLEARRTLSSQPALDQMNQMRIDLAEKFEPVANGRKQMNAALKKLEVVTQNNPSIRDLASRLNAPIQDELNHLRREIRDKLQDVQSITLGNQAVLIYTLDFYHRLMTGISGDANFSQGYNANGQMTQPISTHILEKQC